MHVYDICPKNVTKCGASSSQVYHMYDVPYNIQQLHVYDIIGHLLGHMIPAVFLQGTQMGVWRPLTNNVGQRGMPPSTDGRIPENEDCMSAIA